MKRAHFLKSVGGLSLLPLLPTLRAQSPAPAGNCILIPSETAGPFPLDLTANEFFFRQDIREDSIGVQLRQKVRIIGAGNCLPMPNVRVNIWHCDRDGNYSGYGSEQGLTYCRGYQITDENGECEFITIVPGWYPGRVTHVHFQVHVSTSYSAVSQWTWPHDAVVAAVEAYPDLYPEGPDPMTADQDGVFADGYDLQMATLAYDAANGEYVSEFEATVEGQGTVGVGHEERMTAGVFEAGAVYPNPSSGPVKCAIDLKQPAELRWELWNVAGQKVAEQSNGNRTVGYHVLTVDIAQLGCGPGGYVWQIVAINASGRHVVVRRITRR